MKHVIAYGIILILIGVLFYLQFNDRKGTAAQAKTESREILDTTATTGKIAYINIDTLQNNYKYYQQVKSDLEKKEKSAQNEIVSLQKKFQNRTAELQNKAAQMSPKEQESAMMEINKMQQDFQHKQQSLQEGLADYNQKMK